MPYALRDRSSLKRKYVETEPEDEDFDVELNDEDAESSALIREAAEDMDLDEDGDDFAYARGMDLMENMQATKKKSLIKTTQKPVSKRQKKEKPFKPFRFLDLPAELRDMIYEYALTDNGRGVSLVSKKKGYRRIAARGVVSLERRVWPSRRHKPSPIIEAPFEKFSPALLAVCKQIQSEAAPVLYGQKVYFKNTATMTDFLLMVGASNRGLLVDLTVKGWAGSRSVSGPSNNAAFFLLQDAIALRSVFIDADVGHVRDMASRVYQIFSAAHHFYSAYEKATGKGEATLDVVKLSRDNFNADRYWSWIAHPLSESGRTTGDAATNEQTFNRMMLEAFRNL